MVQVISKCSLSTNMSGEYTKSEHNLFILGAWRAIQIEVSVIFLRPSR
jgi:hypothetical protein